MISRDHPDDKPAAASWRKPVELRGAVLESEARPRKSFIGGDTPARDNNRATQLRRNRQVPTVTLKYQLGSRASDG
jgi:hypothetical protein